ncbi:MAG: hypothetical protein ACRCTZ_19165 [Sarcina sp.]
MSVIIKNLIEYEGVDNINITNNNNAFKQVKIDEISKIPINKPNMVQIIKVSVEKNIIDSYLVETPIGRSVEGLTLTGLKLFISGNLKIKIQYLTEKTCNLVNSFFYETAYSGTIVLPKGTKEKSYIAPGILVEDIFIKTCGQREVYTSINLILTANVC